jgi:hypothetical protein
MPKLTADEVAEAHLRDLLREHRELRHVRVRRRGDLLTLESGPAADAFPHARFRRETVQYWRLEMPTASGRWEKTPHRGLLAEQLQALVELYPWMLSKP